MKTFKLFIILIITLYVSANTQWYKVAKISPSCYEWHEDPSFLIMNSFCFITERIGYLSYTKGCGSPGTFPHSFIIKSSDYGISWTKAYKTAEYGCCEQSTIVFSFYDVDKAYSIECWDGICWGIDYYGNPIGIGTEQPFYIKSFAQGSIIYTYDNMFLYNPLTHVKDTIEVSSNYKLYYSLWYDKFPLVERIYFNRDIGIVAARDSNNVKVFWSDKDWANWNETELPLSLNPTDIKFINDSVGFIINKELYIYKTIDRCNNWEQIPVPTSHQMFKIEFTKNAGYILCNNGILLESKDMGDSWYEVPFPTENHLRKVTLANDSVIYIIDHDFNIYCNHDIATAIISGTNVENNIKIYPIPTLSHIVVKSYGSELLNSLNIYNLYGKLVFNRSNIDKNEIKIDLDELSSGVYLLKMLVGNELHIKKIIKQ